MRVVLVVVLVVVMLIFVSGCELENYNKNRNDADIISAIDLDNIDQDVEMFDDDGDINNDGNQDEITDEFADESQDEKIDDPIDEDLDEISEEIIDEDSDGTFPFCGNGDVEKDEDCDDGNASNQDGCKNDCTLNYCGDGHINIGFEVCDGGSASCISLGIGINGSANCLKDCNGWDVVGNCFQVQYCDEKPDGTIWNDNGKNGIYFQEWNGSSWIPVYLTEYSNVSEDCKFRCDAKYYWDGSKCIETHGSICTGMTKCYDSTGEVLCSEAGGYYGQDALYLALGKCIPRYYTVTGAAGSDIVKDNITGLIWQRTLSSDKYSWQEAIDYCNNLIYGGQNDWRLPSSNELQTIVDYGTYNPSIDAVVFPGTYSIPYSSNYWSSSDSADPSSEYAHGVSFFNGTDASSFKTTYGYARCVRGAELPDQSFAESTVLGEEIVTDMNTGLIWQKEYFGTMTLLQAFGYCENLSYSGYTDWRLPNINELISLVDRTKFGPASSFPGMTNDSFWSSSTYYSSKKVRDYFVAFQSGGIYMDTGNSTSYKNARCVR